MNRKDFISTIPGAFFIPTLLNGMDIPNFDTFENFDNSMNEKEIWKKIHSQFHIDKKFLDLRTFAASNIPKQTLELFITISYILSIIWLLK